MHEFILGFLKYLRIRSFFINIICILALFVPSIAGAASPIHASLIIDQDTGTIYHQENAWEKRHPASLVKMMTLYMTFESLRNNKLSMNQFLTVSRHAASMQRTNINLKAGQRISVKTAILALVVHSANDAAVVLGEAIGGTEQRFAQMMTKRAASLGMNSTVFANATGLHHVSQVSTAADMAKLALALKRHYPEYYKLFRAVQFNYNGTTYRSHNRVVLNNSWVDGLKTGFINKSGFNIVTSGEKHGKRLVGVVFGGHSAKARDTRVVSLLNSCFNKINGTNDKEITTVAVTKKAKKSSKLIAQNNAYKKKKTVSKNKVKSKKQAMLVKPKVKKKKTSVKV